VLNTIAPSSCLYNTTNWNIVDSVKYHNPKLCLYNTTNWLYKQELGVMVYNAVDYISVRDVIQTRASGYGI
jgi:hypothetical protein